MRDSEVGLAGMRRFARRAVIYGAWLEPEHQAVLRAEGLRHFGSPQGPLPRARAWFVRRIVC
jgi:hypothetical protein